MGSGLIACYLSVPDLLSLLHEMKYFVLILHFKMLSALYPVCTMTCDLSLPVFLARREQDCGKGTAYENLMSSLSTIISDV